jgi:hypothetical protein
VQQRQKAQADNHRSERQFEVGQSVFVKLQPYVQNRVAQRTSQNSEVILLVLWTLSNYSEDRLSGI